jgi:diguanylate cyclase (GGDEF)-like protein
VDEGRLATVLVDFARTLTTDFSIQTILDHLVQRVGEVIPIDGAGVLLMKGDSAHHFVAASDEVILRVESLQIDLDEGPCLQAFRTGERVQVPDLREDSSFPRFSKGALDAGLGAVFSFPLSLDSQPLGALELYAREPVELSATDLEGAQILADVTAAYLFNAQARAEAKDNARALHEKTLHDSLTGLPNRALLRDRLELAVTKSGRSRRFIGLLFLDLDHFKAVNDAFGHHVGDELLLAVVDRIRHLLRPGDTLARLSGDEFVVLCEGLSAHGQAEEVAERIIKGLSAPFAIAGQRISMTASVGIAFAGHGHDTAARALIHADAAMYQAKSRGGARHTTATSRALSVSDRRRGLGQDLAAALREDGLHLDYQPIVDLRTSAWAGVEALLRWDHPAMGALAPVAVLEAADAAGLTLELAGWVLGQACHDLRGWQLEGLVPPPMVAVNVSIRELLHPRYAALVARVLEESQLAPQMLFLEITESILLEDDGGAQRALSALRELGITMALDDFGTGYSSLNHLKRFPVSMVKIDRSFVTNLGRDRIDDAIVSAVVDLAHVLDLTVVAEGVETQDQLAQVQAVGCEQFQGFVYSPAVSAAALHALMLARP